MDLSIDTWSAFAVIGTISFALQGGLIAMEKKYDIFAVYFFGLLTSFGGGLLQNIIIGGPDYQLWNQQTLFIVAMISITLVIIFPHPIVKREIFLTNILDAFGVVAFAIQGSLTAINLELPASAVVVSAIATATGGGIIRDLLSQRKPIILERNIYGLWISLIGIIMGVFRENAIPYQYMLFSVFSALHIISFIYKWRIPYRKY
ncbi:TRIC cation channel family protein [Jeotgalibaca sp. MA1X17-3]|uniref:trimeric intracellular cation channel family protein n=1 Tax=Jeotgalibaca sp. MA1X17-3 TaxID=2908211 RepID=UPI001F35F0F1|nr:TRIC cation channel family protein [Jeotgalibaca sp. MA1X17-3]UJF16470.1 TRIC cation channel family protein [Jeotgalibaca sp. MA1X17-3]